MEDSSALQGTASYIWEASDVGPATVLPGLGFPRWLEACRFGTSHPKPTKLETLVGRGVLSCGAEVAVQEQWKDVLRQVTTSERPSAWISEIELAPKVGGDAVGMTVDVSGILHQFVDEIPYQKWRDNRYRISSINGSKPGCCRGLGIKSDCKLRRVRDSVAYCSQKCNTI